MRRGDSCEDVVLLGCVETESLRGKFLVNCTWQSVASSMNIERAAVDKGLHMSGEGTMRRDSGCVCSTRIDIKT